MRALLLIALLISLPLAASAKDSSFPTTGTFSDVRCIEDEGDVLGLEVSILGGFDGYESTYKYYAVVQFSEGVAGIPQLVPVNMEGNNISFTANYLGQFDVKFSGAITKEGLVGSFAKPLDQKVELPRHASFWQSPGNLCYR